MITMKRIILMMAVLAALYAAASSKDQPVLNDLTGEIVFEEGGNKTTALDGSYCIIDIYELLYISYSGEEDVDFTILVNDRNLLEDEDLSQNVSWDEDNNRYVVFLFGLIRHFSDWYSAHLNFVVTIQASGYNSITSEHSSFVSYVESSDGLNISEYGSTDLSYLITVDYRCGVFYCNIDSLCINKDDDDWSSHPIYAVKRLDHDYYITILAAHKTPMSTVYSYIEKTFLIPARTSNIAIHNNDFIIPCMIYDKELGSIYYTGEQEYGRCFAFITANNIDTNSFIFSQLSVSVDNQLQLVKYAYPYAPATAINLLQFGDIYGGKYQINATMTDGYYSLSVDTVLEIHPIATRLTPDSLIIDINPSLDNITLLVNGEEVESSTDRNYYALPRLVHDYSITVQAGVKITIDYYEGENYTLSEWSDETTIIIPSKCVGDVDDNGLVNISDVTALIDYLLNNDASAINLSNADCDGNGLVNISDVTCLIDYLLSGTWH